MSLSAPRFERVQRSACRLEQCKQSHSNVRIAEIFRANVVDSTLESFVFELVGTPAKLDAFADLMRPLGLVDLARTGVAALSRGA